MPGQLDTAHNPIEKRPRPWWILYCSVQLHFLLTGNLIDFLDSCWILTVSHGPRRRDNGPGSSVVYCKGNNGHCRESSAWHGFHFTTEAVFWGFTSMNGSIGSWSYFVKPFDKIASYVELLKTCSHIISYRAHQVEVKPLFSASTSTYPLWEHDIRSSLGETVWFYAV